jgi:hypothetical protein
MELQISCYLFHAIFLPRYSLNLKTKETRSSETSVNFQRITRLYIPENITFHNYRCENLKSCTDVLNSIDEQIPNICLVHTLLTGDEEISVSVEFKSLISSIVHVDNEIIHNRILHYPEI